MLSYRHKEELPNIRYPFPGSTFKTVPVPNFHIKPKRSKPEVNWKNPKKQKPKSKGKNQKPEQKSENQPNDFIDRTDSESEFPKDD